jgi:hypothetical protein
MTSRERIRATLDHREPDRLPVDFGGGMQTGMAASVVCALRQALGLDRPGTPVRVIEPYQMLGEIAPDLQAALGLDAVSLAGTGTMFGFPLDGWKEWRMPDGTPVLVPGGFNTSPEPNGDLLQYPEGDRSCAPCARMPAGGHFFDAIIRQEPVDETALKVEDNLEEFQPVSDAALARYAREAERLRATGRAVFATFGGLTFGDVALVPAPWLRDPKGIRDVEEWYISTATRPEFVRAVFDRQAGIAVANLERLNAAVGDRIDVIQTNGTDFGTQCGPFLSPARYRDLFLPFQKRVNGWIHAHTPWKTFMHCCGGVEPLLDLIVEAEFDILNPVQCSAAGMEPAALKRRFGSRLVFWGGGVDTQKTLPFGTPAQVREEVASRIETFAPGGGYVFNTVHNIVAGTPVANVLAMFETVKRYR